MNKKNKSLSKITSENFDSFIENILEGLEYTEVPSNQFMVSKFLNQQIYAKKYPIKKTIYNTATTCDFAVYHPDKHPNGLSIEARWQQSSGTVDEKYPYLVQNIKLHYSFKTIIILDGGGYRVGAEKWLRDQVDNKLIAVLNMTEFQKWVNDGGL